MSSDIRILHILNQLSLGGTEKTAQIFCEYLNKNEGVFSKIFAFKGGEREIALHNADVSFDIGDVSLLSKEIRDFEPHIIHLHRAGWAEDATMSAIAIQKSRGFDCKIVETNIFGDVDRGQYQGIIDLHLFVSNYIKFWHDKGQIFDKDLVPQSKKKVLYNPIYSQRALCQNYVGRSYQSERYRENLDIKEDSILIGRIGRADNHDGISHKAMELIWGGKTEIDPEKVFYVAVSPQKGTEIPHKNYRKADSILIDVNPFYEAIDVFAHDRIDGETFGCCIAESMMVGTPVVTHVSQKYLGQIETMEKFYNEKVISSIVKKGVNSVKILESGVKPLTAGFIVNRDDPKAYAKAIEKSLFEEGYDAVESSQLAYDKYRAELICNQLLGHYKTLLEIS